MPIFTIIIPSTVEQEDAYDTGDSYVRLIEVKKESPPTAPYEVVEKEAEKIAEARGWKKE